MAQDPPICRFCLDSNDVYTNTLISPCECKGSMRYVHQLCLARWRRINPARNGEICLLCLEPYRREYIPTMEFIPDGNTVCIFLLRFPFVISITINYVGLFYYTLTAGKRNIYAYFEEFQYWSQAVYFLLFFLYWRVNQRERYWKRWATKSTFFLVGFHILFNTMIHEHHMIAVLPLNYILSLYWRNHVQFLEELNTD